MKKLIPVVIILALALFLGAPYITGKIAETETMKMVAAIQQDTATYGDIDVVSYDRGFRSTTAKYRYSPPAFMAAIIQSEAPIEFGCESKHGILGINYECQLQGEGNYADFVAEKLDGKDPFSIYGSVSVFGAITQTYELKAIKDLDMGGQVITTPNALFTVKTDNEMSAFNVTGGSKPFQIEDEGSNLEFGAINVDADLTSIGTMLFTGPFNVSLDKLNFKDAQEEFSLSGFSLSSLNVENGENLDSRGTFKIESMKIAGSPINDIKDAEATIEFNGMDTKAFAEYQAFSLDIQKKALTALESGEEPQIDPNAMMGVLPILERMLKSGLEMNINAKAKLNNSDNKLNFSSALLESLSFSEMGMFVAAPEQALKKLDLKLNTSLASSLVDSQPMAAAILEQSPLIKKTSDAYTLNFSSQQTIELNGKTVTFEELQGMVFASMGF